MPVGMEDVFNKLGPKDKEKVKDGLGHNLSIMLGEWKKDQKAK